MAITVLERALSRDRTEGEAASATLLFEILGTEDDDEAMGALLGTAPTVFRNLVRQSPHIEPQGGGLWFADVRYGRREPKQQGDWKLNFDTSGATAHITQSKETIGRYAASGQTAPDFDGAIGVTDDAIEGCDIIIPKFDFSLDYYFPASFITTNYANVVAGLTGKTNGAGFWGFAAGEVLFHGATGSTGDGEETLAMNFKFTASPNAYGLLIGGISIPFKGGHHYLWFRYEDEKDEAAKRLVKRPIAAYVERVYDAGNFSALGIG